MSDITSVFAADGALSRAIPGYRVRPQQIEMAARIAAAIDKHGVLVAEAGTGTGKTFAYLVPALAAGGKLIISTGTKTLQDQLFQRDLPMVRDALGAPATIALLKGRANYVCPYHLERARHEGRFASREAAAHIHAIARFAKTTNTGDKAECVGVPEDSPAWLAATSTRDNCLGQECPNAKECFVMAARREAQAADVVVVNHHLFFADVMLRDTGLAELLPACNTVIFDEAHQLPETASLFFGESVSTAQLLELARDARTEAIAAAKDFAALPEGSRALEKAARDLRLAVPGENARLSLAQMGSHKDFGPALDKVEAELAGFAALLESQAERSEGLENCWRRAVELGVTLKRWRGADHPSTGSGRTAPDSVHGSTSSPRTDSAVRPEPVPTVRPEPVEGRNSVRWVEVFSQALVLNATPLFIADIFKRQMEGHPRAWIFTSATLAVERDFSHYCTELGLEDADTGCWGSPFDYENQAVLYVPEGLPDPNSREYLEAVVEAVWPVIRASRGRAFVLCTSLRAMRRIHELLAARFEEEKFDHPLLLQGEGSKSELLSRFRRLGNAVLVASQSFWEGVDVRGEALSLVVIDKLPFAPPDDPVLSARIEHMKKEGRNAFMEYQLPRAVINVKQGAGRLIRDEDDRGVLMICDPRLITKQYGKRVWRSLPPMRRTRALAEVLGFFEAAEGEGSCRSAFRPTQPPLSA